MAEEQYLSNKYRKWDHFEDSDSENEDMPRVPTQFDVEGDADIEISTEMLVSREQIERMKKLDQTKMEVWQVVVRKLRVWSASSAGADEGDDAVPCRPYCILVNNLYPQGQVLSKSICDPPEVYPSASRILELTLQTMTDPPSGIPQHRPDKLVFPDKSFVGLLRKSYAAMQIECSYLSESEGIDTYIQELSSHLVQKDFASVADVNERPGLSSGDGITPELMQHFYRSCARYARLEPWKHLAERQAIQVDASEDVTISRRHHVPSGSIFASVIATETPDASVHGMAVFFNRNDLQRRVLPPGERLALLDDPSLRRCGFCDKKAEDGQELKKCTRCKSTFYCNVTCQKNHWKTHKVSCTPDVEVQTDKIVWGVKEMSILFSEDTGMPFNDLDGIDKYEWEVANDQSYPSAIVFDKGEPTVPTAKDLVWFVRGLEAMCALLESHPKFMNDSMVEFIGNMDVKKVQVEANTLGLQKETLEVRNGTVLTTQDVDKMKELMQRKKKGEEGGEGEGEGEEGGGEEGEEDKGCLVM